MRNPYKKMMGNVRMASKNKGSARNTISEDMKRTLVNGPNGPYRMKKTHDVDIVWEDLRDQFEIEQKSVDFWTGMPIDLNEIFVPHSIMAPSVDRLDDSKGYVKGNFVITTRFIKLGRGNTSVKNFKLFLKNMKKTLTHMAI